MCNRFSPTVACTVVLATAAIGLLWSNNYHVYVSLIQWSSQLVEWTHFAYLTVLLECLNVLLEYLNYRDCYM